MLYLHKGYKSLFLKRGWEGDRERGFTSIYRVLTNILKDTALGQMLKFLN